jgi:hypothetical protein
MMSNRYYHSATVIDCIVQRLVDEGIIQSFGVPGDYAFPVCDAVERNPKSTGSAAQTKCIWRSFRPALNTGMKPRRLKQPETSTTKHLLLKRRSHVL